MKTLFMVVPALTMTATAASAECTTPRSEYENPVCTDAVPSGYGVNEYGTRTDIYAYRTYQLPSRAQIEYQRALQLYRKGYRDCYGC
jgi:hypothetical protein